MGLGIMTKVKRIVRHARSRRQRRVETNNYRSGKVALGERLFYGFPRDWVHVDWKDADFRVNLVDAPRVPLPDSSADLVYSAHLIEHLTCDSLRKLLKDCHRVLRPGGRIRLECPDTEKLVDLYRRQDPHMIQHFRKFRRETVVGRFGFPERYLEDHLALLGEVANYIVDGHGSYMHAPAYATREEFEARFNSLPLEEFAEWCFSLLTPEQKRSGGHQNILYYSKLRGLLEEAGFVDVEQVDFGVTTIPTLELNGGPGSIQEKPHRAFYSLYVEATRA